MTDVVVTEALGESLSPSQVSSYMTCPAKWYFLLLDRIERADHGSAGARQSVACNATLARNFRQRLVLAATWRRKNCAKSSIGMIAENS